MKWLVLLPLLALVASAMGTGAANITVTTGETFIKYTWDTGYDAQVWHNGVYDLNTSLNYLYLSDLKPSERHRLTLYNQSNLTEQIGDVTVETAMPSTLLYVMAGTGLIFLILSLLYLPSYFSILDGVCAVIIFAIVSVLMASRDLTFTYLAEGLAVFPGILVTWNLYSIGKERVI